MFVIDRLKWNVIFQFNMQVWYDMMFFQISSSQLFLLFNILTIFFFLLQSHNTVVANTYVYK